MVWVKSTIQVISRLDIGISRLMYIDMVCVSRLFTCYFIITNHNISTLLGASWSCRTLDSSCVRALNDMHHISQVFIKISSNNNVHRFLCMSVLWSLKFHLPAWHIPVTILTERTDEIQQQHPSSASRSNNSSGERGEDGRRGWIGGEDRLWAWIRGERRETTSWSEDEKIRAELGIGFGVIYMRRESAGFGFRNPNLKPDRTRAVRIESGSGFRFQSGNSIIPEHCSPLFVTIWKSI